MKRARTNSVSNSSSDEAAIGGTSSSHPKMKANEYTIVPTNSFFDGERLKNYIILFTTSEASVLLADSEETLRSLITRFSKKLVQRKHYIQFVYKKIPCVALATNAYRLSITNSDDFRGHTMVSNLKHLRPTHRVSLLLPKVDDWWHEPSKQLMRAFIERIINDIKLLGSNEAFKRTVHDMNLKVVPTFATLRAKMITVTKILSGNAAPSPGIFNIKIHTSMGMPSDIDTPIGFIKSDGSLKTGKWSNLLPPTYMQAVMIIRCRGFKLMKNNLTFDLELLNLAYAKLDRLVTTKTVLNENLFQIPGMASASSDESRRRRKWQIKFARYHI